MSIWVSHNPRTLRHSSDSSDTEKGNELAKSFVRLLSPVALKSLGPLACMGSTASLGTIIKELYGISERLLLENRTSSFFKRRTAGSERNAQLCAPEPDSASRRNHAHGPAPLDTVLPLALSP